jgi:guanylate kinase
MDIRRRGLMLVLSSPSGAGKTTISRMLLERDSNLRISISVTTRPPRPGEVHGRDYFFITAPEFDRMVETGALLEHALVFGNRYGTPRAAVEQMLGAGRDVLFDIDWQGTQQLGEKARDDLDSEEEVQRRMSKAADEMSHWAEYQYVIVNRDLEESVAKVQSILTAERLRRDRQSGLSEFVRDLRGS